MTYTRAVRDVFFGSIDIKRKIFEFQSGEDLRGFYTAIINDDIPTVNSILNAHPELLLIELPKDFVIESQFTWQKFLLENENALSIAVKLKKMGRTNRPGIIETLLHHFDRLEHNLEEELQNLDRVEQTDEVIRKKNKIIYDKDKLIEIKTEALASWSYYDYRVIQDETEIVIPEKYSSDLQSLIDKFIQETFPNQIVLNNNPNNIDYKYANLSEPTEEALTGLLDKLVPELPQKINDYPDELLLYTAYKIYIENFNRFQNWQQRNAFCIRVIGLIQSVLSPESAKIFCQGLYDVVERNAQIDTQAEALKLHHWNGGLVDFYRSSPDSRIGLGVEYLAGAAGRGACVFAMAGLGPRFGKIISNKSSRFSECYATTNPADIPYPPSSGYNISEEGIDNNEPDASICSAGTFNKLIEKLAGVHCDVSVRYITKEIATIKLKIVAIEQAQEYLDNLPIDEDIETLKDKINAEDMDYLWSKILPKVKERMFDEFSSLYPGGIDSESFNNDVETGIYALTRKALTLSTTPSVSRNSNTFFESKENDNEDETKQSKDLINASHP